MHAYKCSAPSGGYSFKHLGWAPVCCLLQTNTWMPGCLSICPSCLMAVVCKVGQRISIPVTHIKTIIWCMIHCTGSRSAMFLPCNAGRGPGECTVNPTPLSLDQRDNGPKHSTLLQTQPSLLWCKALLSFSVPKSDLCMTTGFQTPLCIEIGFLWFVGLTNWGHQVSRNKRSIRKPDPQQLW